MRSILGPRLGNKTDRLGLRVQDSGAQSIWEYNELRETVTDNSIGELRGVCRIPCRTSSIGIWCLENMHDPQHLHRTEVGIEGAGFSAQA